MPLRDHFRPPLDNLTAWEGFLAGWPAVIVQTLSRRLPQRYAAAPRVQPEGSLKIELPTHDSEGKDSALPGDGHKGEEQPGIWLPALPSLALTTDLPAP